MVGLHIHGVDHEKLVAPFEHLPVCVKPKNWGEKRLVHPDENMWSYFK